MGQDKFPKRSGTVSLVSPRFDLPMKNAHWDLYLPPDYDYSQFEGSMTRTSDTTLPMEQVYSLSEYNVQQQAQAGAEQAGVALRAGVGAQRPGGRQPAEGDQQLWPRQVQGRQGAGRSSRGPGTEGAGAGRSPRAEQQPDRRAEQLLLRRTPGGSADQQALQLQQAQVIANAPAQQQQAMPQGAPGRNLYLNYDENVASLQWDKLEKAQQVAVAKVAPLHVNLPTRGVRYSFSPGAANRTAQADDHPPAGREHQGPELDHAPVPGGAGLCCAVGCRGHL